MMYYEKSRETVLKLILSNFALLGTIAIVSGILAAINRPAPPTAVVACILGIIPILISLALHWILSDYWLSMLHGSTKRILSFFLLISTIVATCFVGGSAIFLHELSSQPALIGLVVGQALSVLIVVAMYKIWPHLNL